MTELTSTDTGARIYNLFDWTAGIRNQTINPLASESSSLFAGGNIDIEGPGLRVRNGYNVISSLPAAGAVVYLGSFMFPTTRTTYLLAQIVEASGSSRLFASYTPHEPLSWNQIYDFGLNAGVVSVSALNDRAIITEGKASPPLVFSGGLDPSGADWATPIAVLLTRDSGVTWIDVSDSALDTDADSTLDIGTLTPGNGWILVCLDTRITTGLFIDLTTPGSTPNPIIIEPLGDDWGPGLNISDGRQRADPLRSRHMASGSGPALTTDYQQYRRLLVSNPLR